MKRKFLMLLLALASALCVGLAFTACGSESENPGDGNDGQSAHEHSLSHVSAADPTCTESGHAEYWYCEDCDIYFTDSQGTNKTTLSELTTDPLGHILIPHIGKASTCREYGWETYLTCSRCDYTTYKELPLLEHNFVGGICTACGDKQPTEGLTYELSTDNKYYTVTGIGDAAQSDITIASTYNGLLVTRIDEEAFRDCKITGITIPDTIATVGSRAFNNCTLLESVIIPDSVTSIGNNAFENCSNLVNVSISRNVTNISDSLFKSCLSLAEISIPDGVTEISIYAFDNCINLSDVSLPDSITTIESSAFRGCTSLESIELPKGVTSIGISAFENCSALKEITIPEGVTDIDPLTFQGCESLA